jgi:hypothetical protein
MGNRVEDQGESNIYMGNRVEDQGESNIASLKNYKFRKQ